MIAILYVDDEPGLLEVAKLFLERSGEFTVDTRTSVQEVLDTSGIAGCNAIVSDYQMPGMDGIAFLKAVRQRYGDIPFILFTGRGREEVVIEAINNGADFYLQKGGDPKAQFAELAHKVRQAVARRQAELQRTESEKRLSDIINFLPDATFAIDRAGKVIAWNRAIEEMTGVPAKDMLGKGNFEYALPFYGARRKILIDLIFEPDDVIEKNYAHIFHEKDILIADTTLPRPKGRALMLMGKASPLYDRQGRIVGAIESIRDITGLKTAEEGLFRARKDWETIFRAIGHPAIVLDADNRIIDANDATLRATGRTLEGLKGRHCYEVFHQPGADRPPERCPFEQMRRTGTSETGETEIEALDGHYAVTCTPVYGPDGKLEKVIHIAMDVTSRHRAEEELRAANEQLAASDEELRGQYEELAFSEQRIRESESRFRQLADATLEGIVIHRAGIITDLNERACELFGYPRDEMIGRNVLTLAAPDHIEFMNQNIAQGNESPYEAKGLRKDGSAFWAEIQSRNFSSGHETFRITTFWDITDRKSAEQSIRQSEEKYRALVEVNHDIIYSLDIDGTVIYVSPQIREQLGYRPEEITGGNFMQFIHPDDVGNLALHIREHAGGGRPVEADTFRIRRKDGTYRWFEDRTIYTTDPRGKQVVIGTIRDVTEEKLARDALRRSEEKFRAIIDQSFQFIGLMNTDGTLIAANRSALAFAGIAYADVINRPFWETPWWSHSGEQQDILKDAITRAASGETVRFEATHPAADGNLADIDFSIKPVLDPSGRVLYLIPEGRDISERKKAENALRESEDKYRTVVEQSNDGIIIAKDGILVFHNPAVAAMSGYTDAELDGRPIADLIAPEDRELVLARHRGRLEGKVLPPAYEFSLLHHDGRSRIRVMMNISPGIFGGKPATIGTLHNVTEDRKRESALKQSEEKYRAAFEKNHDAFVLATADGVFDCNRQALSLFQYASRQELLGLHPAQLSPQFQPDGRDSASAAAAHFRTAFEQGEDRFEWLHKRKDGSTFLADVMLSAFELEGTPVYQASIRDITDRKRMEDELRLLKISADRSSDEIFWLNFDGTILYVNDAACRITGYSRGELCAMKLFELDPDFPPGVWEKSVADLRRRKTQFITTRHRCKDGTVLDVEIVAVYVNQGEREYSFAFVRDITAREHTEEALRQANIVVENSPAVVFRWKAEDGWPVAYVSQNVSRFGYEPDELLSGTISYAAMVHADDLARVAEEVRQYSHNGAEKFRQEYRLVTRDGRIIWVDDHTVVERDDDGKITHYQGILIDITERKLAEEALRESEEKYRTLIERANEAIIIAQDGRFVFANRRMSELFGVPVHELEGRPFIDFIAPEDREMVASRHQKRANGEIVPDTYDIRIISSSGKQYWFVISAARITWKGRPATLNLLTDITGRKLAEAALRESEERYKKIFGSFVDIYFEIDRNGIVRVLSPSVLPLSGWKPEELVGKPATTIYADPADRSRLVEQMERDHAVNGFEIMARKRDGTVAPVSINARIRLSPQGEPDGIVGTIHDISDSAKVREALLLSEKKYRHILENMQDAYIQTDTDGNLSMVSPSAARIYGYESAAGMIGLPAASLYRHPEERREMLRQLEEKGRVADFIIEGVRKDGTVFWASLNVQFRTGESGRIIGTEGTVRDITVRKMMEHSVREANRKLNLLNSITRHDVVNQITVLQGLTQIAAMKESDPVVADLLSKIETAAKTIGRQIAFTKTYQELGVRSPSWFRIGDVVKKSGNGIVKLSDTCRGSEIYADPMLEQVFFNLFDNAVRHGGRVTEIVVRSERTSAGLHIFVEDNGIGIPAKEKTKVFERGYGNNTGLGLFLVKEILAITGISIRETGIPGNGARFEMLVPAEKYRVTE